MRVSAKKVAKIVVIAILVVITMVGYDILKRETQVSIVGGRTEVTAVQISYDETIDFKVFMEKNDRMSDVYAYWDDNKNDKLKLKKSFWTAKGEIEVPDTNGIHKLTIERGFFIKFKTNYYYEVIRGESE